jgi:hypothetical protein
MELKINEFEDGTFCNDDDYEQIPENTVHTKTMKHVHFDKLSTKPMHQAIPKENAKIVRTQVPSKKPQISYEDIMAKMGMLVSNGKLHLVDRNNMPPHLQQQIAKQTNVARQPNSNKEYNEQQEQAQKPYYDENLEQHVPQNNYIYNKYFKDELNQPQQIRKPRTLEEYKTMLLQNHLQRQRIKQIKSTKLIMPTSNISMATNSSNLNKLFNFSKR